MRLGVGLLLLGWILTSPALFAGTPLILPTEAPVHIMDQGELSLLLDPSQALTLDDAQAALSEGRFKVIKGNLGLGYRPDAAWLYFQVEQPADQAISRWLEIPVPFLDDVRLYHIDPDGVINEYLAGDRLPHSAKEVGYRATLIKLQLSPGTHQFFLRIQTSSTLAAIVKLWQPQVFEQYQRTSYFLYGLYFSLFFAVVLFNIANWLVSRRPIFLLYVLYVGLVELQWLGINGFVAEFLLPEAPLLANLSLGVTISLANAMTYLFFAQILEFKRYHPILYRISLLGFVVSLSAAIGTPFGYYQYLAPMMMLVGILALLGVPWPTLRLWRMRELWARLLGLAYLASGMLISINLMGIMAIIPFSEAVLYAGMATNVFHILLLHFGILLQYRRIEKEHAQALEKATLVEQRAAMERAHFEEQGKMLAMLTHEIRTPITVIDAAQESLKLLDGNQAHDDNRRRRYERIHNAVMRINIVLELALAQQERERLPFEPLLVDLTWLTFDVIELNGEENRKRILFEPSEEELVTCIDPRLIRIALLNLLGNALKYSPPDSMVWIHIASQDSDEGQPGYAWIIEDQGPGVIPEMSEKIFEKGYRGERQSGDSGMGLGLFLVATIATRHSGRVRVENLPKSGCRFVFWIPEQTEESP